VLQVTKCLLFASAGIGLLTLIGTDLAQLVRGWLDTWHIRQDTAVVQWLLTTLGEIHPDQLTLTGIGSLLYGLIVGTQGVGLWMAAPWAITMTVYGLSAFIPLEIYELLHRLTKVKIGILVLNILIVGYLWKQYYRTPSKLKTSHAAPSTHRST
jgi:uncharacterized membrane protein (DUF2068 family)